MFRKKPPNIAKSQIERALISSRAVPPNPSPMAKSAGKRKSARKKTWALAD